MELEGEIGAEIYVNREYDPESRKLALDASRFIKLKFHHPIADLSIAAGWDNAERTILELHYSINTLMLI